MSWCEHNDLRVSNKYQFRKIDKDNKIPVHFIKHIDHTVEVMKNLEGKKVRFISNKNLANFLFQMLDQKYVPNIRWEGNHITTLGFSLAGVYATIENADITSPNDSFIEIPDVATYNKYHEIDDMFYEKLVNKRYLS